MFEIIYFGQIYISLLRILIILGTNSWKCGTKVVTYQSKHRLIIAWRKFFTRGKSG